MKILIVNTYDILGGAARAAYRLHRSLLSAGIDSKMYNVLANCNQKIEKFYSMNVNYLTKGGH